jgi:hypothetical protein
MTTAPGGTAQLKVPRARAADVGAGRPPAGPPPDRPRAWRRPVQLAGRYGAAVLGAAFVLALGGPRLGRRPFWLDEAFTVGATHDLVATWRGTGGTMGLYYLLEWPMAQVSTDRAWLRLPSLLFAAGAVVVVHEIGRIVGGRRMGAMAAGLLAGAWAVSRFGLEARSYTLALLLVSLSWLGLVGAVSTADRGGSDTARRRWWWSFAVAALLAPLAHGLAALHFGSQVAVLGLRRDRWRWWRACIPVALGLAVEGVGLFAIGAGEVANWIEPLNTRQVERMLRFLVGEDDRLTVVGGLVVVAIVVAVISALRSGRRDPSTRGARDEPPVAAAHLTPSAAGLRSPGSPAGAELDGSNRGWLGLVPVFWLLGVPLLIIGLSLFRPYGEPRYVISAVPGVALVLAGLLSRIRPAVLAAAAWVAVALVVVTDQPRITSYGTEDWPALVGHITADGRDGDLLLMPAMLRAPFDYAWAEDPEGAASRPDLVPLSPTDDLGDVKRFYDAAPGGMGARMRTAPATDATIWYVDRDIKRLDDVERLIADPEVARRYEVAGRWQLVGELYLVRFEPRPEPIAEPGTAP